MVPKNFSKILLQKEELEQKHLHLVQIVESEKTAKWQYTQQCEELTIEIKKLRAELNALKREWRLTPSKSEEEESEEIRKIKKVQSFFRGWLCRRRWKQIVAEYISSPHAENMRKRNRHIWEISDLECEKDFSDDHREEITGFVKSIPGFQECDEDAETWMACDAEECVFQMLNGDEIGTSVQEESDLVDDETDEDENSNNNDSSKGPSNAVAISALETAIQSVRFHILHGLHSVFGYPNNRVSERYSIPIDSDKRHFTVTGNPIPTQTRNKCLSQLIRIA
ncbi:ras-specific guanine nucleotide-releasing factor 1 [Trichonephila clavipes]|nr:ras-specific guanine nucleotide-releasing factor 1 [Trichonephila clavipes]